MNTITPSPAQPAGATGVLGDADGERISALSSKDLLRGRSVVPIEHGGLVYYLRATRSGKLILTK